MIGGYTNPYDVSKRKTEKTTRVLTIQSSDLDVSKKVYADKDRCNYQKHYQSIGDCLMIIIG